MKMTKRIMSILLACLMLMGMLTVGVVAEGTQENPINANEKWFGFGVDCFLINTTLEAGDEDGVWYELTADAAGILQVEHSTPTDEFYIPSEDEEAPELPPSEHVEYLLTVSVNGMVYNGYADGNYLAPVATYPVSVGDVITIHIIAQDTTLGGLVNCNAKIITGENNIEQMVKVKSAPAKLYVAAGATVFFQDDSLQAEYAAQYINLSGDTVEGVTFYPAAANSAGNIVTQKAVTDSDGDGVIEAMLGGSAGGTGAPPVKPAWAIKNTTNENLCFDLTVVETAHECGGKYACSATCKTCGVPVPAVEHAYAGPFDANCDYCNEARDVAGITSDGTSVSVDKNGLAVKFDADVQGMGREANGFTAIYDNATIGEYKLISMGAVAWNDGADTPYDIEAADGQHVLNIPIEFLHELDEDTASYSVRVINIPDDQKDTLISFRSYFIYEDENGTQHTVYGDVVSATYNG